MKKLTQAVFDLPECPVWAESAAVDENGIACWYPDSYPHLNYNVDSGVWGSEWSLMCKIIGSGFDTTNWQQSAIDRGEK